MRTGLTAKPPTTVERRNDGSVATLPEAGRLRAQQQLGIELPARGVTAIVTWLQPLKGELPRDYIAQPQLPTRNSGKDRT
jgi:hypothetical protein